MHTSHTIIGCNTLVANSNYVTVKKIWDLGQSDKKRSVRTRSYCQLKITGAGKLSRELENDQPMHVSMCCAAVVPQWSCQIYMCITTSSTPWMNVPPSSSKSRMRKAPHPLQIDCASKQMRLLVCICCFVFRDGAGVVIAKPREDRT